MVAAVIGGFWIALGFPDANLLVQGGDAHNYWASHLPQPYVGTEGQNTFLYSPVAAFAIYPLTLLPYDIFHVVWAGLSIGALVWMAGPWALPLLLFPPVTFELWLGQCHLLLAAAIVLSFRYPAAWSAILLTKVTPGIGVIWFAVRGEWRSLAVALGVTAGLAGLTMAIAPSLWADWFDTLRSSQPVDVLVITTAALPIRLTIAGLIVGVAALKNWRWAVPIAAVIALPTVWTFGASMLVACLPLATLDGRAFARLSRPSRTVELRVEEPPALVA